MNANQKVRSVAYVLGLTTIACSGFELYYCYGIAQSVAMGDFISVLQEHDAPHFYEAFWIMLSVSVLWCLCLGWCGLDQIQLKLARFKLFTTALRLFAAEEIDFAQYQIAYIVAAETPVDAPYVGVLDLSPTLSAGIPIATNNGAVHHVVTFGRDSYHRGFRVLVHETGHLFGLPDLYRFHPDTTGEWLTPTGAWDIMCDLDHGWHFLGWHKYKLGWLDESQLVYFSSGELTVRLTALESAQGVKMIVVPSEHSSQLYIVEIAQSLGDNETFRDKGLLIYAVDASVATGHEPVSVLRCGSRSEDLTVGMRCNDFVAPGESHIVRLPNGERVEVFNRERHGADFEVTVVSTSAGEPGDREPIPCRICQDAEARSIWVRTT